LVNPAGDVSGQSPRALSLRFAQFDKGDGSASGSAGDCDP
jgi:hypothetical protein